MAEEVLSSFCMRATITVDGELAERIERLSRERATSFEDLTDAALREGLEHLVGTNLLIYAYVKDTPQHEAAFEWFDRQLKEVSKVGLPWAALLAFMRLVSNLRIFTNPVSPPAAWQQVETWLSAPSVWIPAPTTRHTTILGGLLSTEGLKANDIPDAHLAALAIEHDLLLCSGDGGYDRFADLRWQSPLSKPGGLS